MTKPSSPPSSLIKPTFETEYHIDYEWWGNSGQELRLYLLQQLCETHRQEFASGSFDDSIKDWISPTSGQVIQVDALTYAIVSHCSLQPNYLTERTSLVDAVFRVLLANGNRPMTPVELAELTGRTPETILRTLSGKTVYKGLRPLIED